MGFLDNVADKAVPQGSGLKKPLVLAFISLLARHVHAVLNTKERRRT